MQEITDLLKQVLDRLDRIERQLSKPKVANLNKRVPKLEVIKTDD